MPIQLSALLQRFADRTPLPVMSQALLRHAFHAGLLDKMYDQTVEQQYTRKLLFSSLFGLMTEVVFRQQPSVRAAYQQASREEVGVSLSAVYGKLNGLEIATLQPLANLSIQSSQEIIDWMEVPVRSWLPNIKTRLLDGNALGGRQRRLLETRGSTAAPLPGKSLVVLDPDRQLIVQLHPCEDAYVQERALLPAVLASVQPNELWVADRNFCTTEALLTIERQGGYSLIREHGRLRFTPLIAEGDSESIEGGRVCEQSVQVTDGSNCLEPCQADCCCSGFQG